MATSFELSFGPVIRTYRYNGHRVEVRGWSETDTTYHSEDIYGFAKSHEEMAKKIYARIAEVNAEAARKIAVVSFELARARRRKVTVVHKQNVMKMSDGLWLREARAVAKGYPDVELDEKIVDATAALLVRDPSKFDVLMCENMFGDILSDEAGELSGSLGLAGSTNQGDHFCVAQAQHGSAPDIAGQGIANPTSLILSAAMLLDWHGRRSGSTRHVEAAALIERSIDAVLADPARRTRDLGGPLGTGDFTAAVAQAVATC